MCPHLNKQLGCQAWRFLATDHQLQKTTTVAMLRELLSQASLKEANQSRPAVALGACSLSVQESHAEKAMLPIKLPCFG